MKNSFRRYIERLMNDKDVGVFSSVMKILLLIASYAYEVLIRCHNLFYKINLLRSYKSKASVISVGNITLGGTGKTPFVIMLAELIAKGNKKVVILIRGYGEDEWKLLEAKLKRYNIKVLVGRDRIKKSKLAEKDNVDTIILDDGFQHRRLKRDIDIVLIDTTNPFGNNHLFPRGILRESPASLKRASVLVFTKADKGKENIPLIEKMLKSLKVDKKTIKAIHRVSGIHKLKDGRKENVDILKNKKVNLLSAICDASYFKYVVEKNDAEISKEFVFPDHHLYEQDTLNHIIRESKAKNIDFIVTTEKDAVKLKKLVLPKDGPEILVLGIEFEIIEGKDTLDALYT